MAEIESKYETDFLHRCGEISCTLNFNEAIQTILDNVEHCLDIQSCAIHLIDPSAQMINVAAVRNLSESYLNQKPVPIADSQVYQDIISGKIVTIIDAMENPAYHHLAEVEGIRSVLGVPLKSKNSVVGVLWLFTKKVRQFTGGEINYISSLSNQGGLVLSNAKLYQSLHALSQIGKAITSRLDLQEILQIIVEKASQLIGAKGASILLLNRASGAMEISATYGLSEQFLKKGPIDIKKSISECMEHLVIIPDTCETGSIQYPEHLKEAGICSILCTPLMVRKKCIGNLRTYLDHRREFSPEDLELFQLLADFGGIAIENARLFNHIKRDYEDLTQDVWQWYDWGKRSPKI